MAVTVPRVERVDRVDQPERQLDILGFFFGAVAGLLDVEIGEDAQQSGADFDAVTARQIDQAVRKGADAEGFTITQTHHYDGIAPH